MTEKRAKLEFEGTDWQSFEIKGKWTTFSVGSVDKDGDVEICMEESQDSHYVFIGQEDIKTLIAHLQKQVKS